MDEYIQILEFIYLFLTDDLIERISSPQYLGTASIKSLSEYFEKMHRSYTIYKQDLNISIKSEHIVLPRIVY
jgi:hypothetical protein